MPNINTETLKPTPDQQLDFQIYLMQRCGLYTQAAQAGVFHQKQEYLPIYDIADDIQEIDRGRISRDIRVALGALTLEKFNYEPLQPDNPTPTKPPKKDDDNLAYA